MSAPPSASSVAISPVAALSSGGPARKARAAAAHHDHVVGQARSCRRRPRSTSRARRAITGRPAAESRARLWKSAPPWMNCFDAVVQQVGAGRSRPGARTAACSRARSPARAAASQRPCGCSAPASMPASSATTMHAHARRRRRCRRCTPPPGTDFSGSSLSSSQPASVESSRNGSAGVEQARDALARQQLAALVEQRPGALDSPPRARFDRAPAARSAPACAARLRRARSGVAVECRQQAGITRPFSTVGRRREMKAVERRGRAAACRPRARCRLRSARRRRRAGTRRRRTPPPATAGSTIAADDLASVPSRPSGTVRVQRRGSASRHLGRIVVDARWRRSSPARPR